MTRSGPAVLAVVPLLLAGCASAVPGDSSFGCRGYPDGVSCVSARDVYALTNSRDRVTNDDIAASQEDPQTTGTTEPTAPISAPPAGTPPAGIRPPATSRPAVGPLWPASVQPDGYRADEVIPLRTPARVLRIWMAPWEDSNGNLMLSGYVYTEVEPRRWQVGGTAAQGPRQLQPVQPRGLDDRTVPQAAREPRQPPVRTPMEPELRGAGFQP